MYEIKKENFFYVSLNILIYTYAIPKITHGPQLFWFRFVFVILRLASILIFVILPAVHLVVTLKAKTGVDVSEDFSTIFGTFGANVTSISFLLLYERWCQFFNGVESCSSFGIPTHIIALRKKLNLYSVLFVLYMAVAAGIYAVIAYAGTSNCEKFNEENGLNEICGTFTPIILPFDGNPPAIRWPIFATQLVSITATFASPGLVCFLLYEGVEILVAYLVLLKQHFVDVFESTSNVERRNRLRTCVRFHDKILRLCKLLSTLGKYSAGFLCMTCGVVFGCIGNLILKSKPIAGMSYLMGYVAALFLLCHGGQRILDETLSVADVVYDSRWYEGDVEIMRDVCFILARTQKPATLRALPLGVMNYSLFLMIIKTSYSYLTVLSQNT